MTQIFFLYRRPPEKGFKKKRNKLYFFCIEIFTLLKCHCPMCWNGWNFHFSQQGPISSGFLILDHIGAPLKIRNKKIGLCHVLSPKLGLKPKCHDAGTFGGSWKKGQTHRQTGFMFYKCRYIPPTHLHLLGPVHPACLSWKNEEHFGWKQSLFLPANVTFWLSNIYWNLAFTLK